jgi:hypothetical protein
MLILCPTKGRYAAAVETWQTFLDTRSMPDTEILFIVNEDEDLAHPTIPILRVPRRQWMNEVLQLGVDHVLKGQDAPSIIGFIGDDNRFRTKGWDARVAQELYGGGIAYGNDLAQGPNLPAHVFISTPIIQALGYFGLPGSHHLYLDNAWKALGIGANCLHYMPDVIVEHLHPAFGKGIMDESYQITNSPATYGHDSDVFSAWLGNRAEQDIQIVRNALA